MNKYFIPKVMAALAIAAAGQAQAAFVTFFGEDLHNSASTQVGSIANSQGAQTAFLSSLVGAGVEDFESRSGGAPLNLSFNGFGGGTLSATLTGSGNVRTHAAGGTNGAGRYSVPGGTRFWETDPGVSFGITFGQKIAAFGFYGIDIGDFGGTVFIDLFDGATLIDTVEVPNTQGTNGSTDGSVLYFGLIAGTAAEQFDRLAFRTTAAGGDVFAFDSFTIAELQQVGTPVPEPGSLALVAAAMLGLGLSRRRR